MDECIELGLESGLLSDHCFWLLFFKQKIFVYFDRQLSDV